MIPTIRYPDWDRRMVAEIARQRDMPFEYGTHDCCLFAADVVYAMTGYDPAEGLRGAYHSAIEAAEILRKCGGLESFTSDMLRVNPAPGIMARRGDICMMDKPRDEPLHQLGVCVGTSILVVAESCLYHRDLRHAIYCWRVD